MGDLMVRSLPDTCKVHDDASIKLRTKISTMISSCRPCCRPVYWKPARIEGGS